jgi:hypothetical protein
VACDSAVITVDLDSDENVIGVELVGVEEFTIQRLLDASGVVASKQLLRDTKYVPAKRGVLLPA